MSKINLIQAKDLDGYIVAKVLDQFEYCGKEVAINGGDYTYYYLYARPLGDFLIQKQTILASGSESMLFYYSKTGNARTVFDSDRTTLTYGEFWEIF